MSVILLFHSDLLQNTLAATLTGDGNYAKETDAVLLFDGDTFRLELLSTFVMNMKRDDQAKPTKHMTRIMDGRPSIISPT